MAWTNLTFAFNSLLTSAKMTQLYDNFQAMADGDSNAPQIVHSTFPEPTAASTYLIWKSYRHDVVHTSTNSASYQEIDFAMPVPRAPGDIRISLSMRVTSGSGTAYVRVYKNGVTQVTFTETSNSFQIKTEDLTVVEGDLISVEQAGDGTVTCDLRYISFYADEDTMPFF